MEGDRVCDDGTLSCNVVLRNLITMSAGHSNVGSHLGDLFYLSVEVNFKALYKKVWTNKATVKESIIYVLLYHYILYIVYVLVYGI